MATELQAALKQVAASTKTASATSADIIQAAKAKPAAKLVATGAKTSIFTHSICLSGVSGFIVGIVAYHLVNKLWLSKKSTAQQEVSE